MKRSVIIDCFPESAERYRNECAIVVVDVIRFTTTATTALSLGRRVFPARTADEAFNIASTLSGPLLVGELGGNMPYGFDLNNSPLQISVRSDVRRPAVIVSSSGTQLLMNAIGCEAVYIACFRNITAVAENISGRHDRLAILGAGTRGQFRREDQMGCAWVAEKLIKAGYLPGSPLTTEVISRWSGASPAVVRDGRSAAYLRKSGQEGDLEFVLDHIDDVAAVPSLVNGELIQIAGHEMTPQEGLPINEN
jgi:2-phosphosulfolactate phosphatase